LNACAHALSWQRPKGIDAAIVRVGRNLCPDPTMPFDTLADLFRENCNVLFQCGGCDKFKELSPHRLAGVQWAPDDLAPLENKTLAEVAAKLKCESCGGRVGAWWPKRRGV
jgi:hypothetical protein